MLKMISPSELPSFEWTSSKVADIQDHDGKMWYACNRYIFYFKDRVCLFHRGPGTQWNTCETSPHTLTLCSCTCRSVCHLTYPVRAVTAEWITRLICEIQNNKSGLILRHKQKIGLCYHKYVDLLFGSTPKNGVF